MSAGAASTVAKPRRMLAQQIPPRHIVAVSALVSNVQNRILLVHSPRGDWEFPGGQVEEGETLTQALQREILEETGVTASVGALVGIYSNIIRHPPIVMFGFLSEWLAGALKTSEESLAVEWVERAEALSRIQRPAIRGRLKDMLDFAGRITYRAYEVDPHAVQAEYKVIEDRFV
jgi:8-oxo-dGTP diphosphatase